MNVTIRFDDRVGRRDQLQKLTEQARPVLEEVLGKSAELVRGEWIWELDERGRELATLRLSDPRGGQAAGAFATDELENASQLWWRIHRLWGDLLQDRSHKQLEELRKSLATSPDA
jgi:hypothetical protein